MRDMLFTSTIQHVFALEANMFEILQDLISHDVFRASDLSFLQKFFYFFFLMDKSVTFDFAPSLFNRNIKVYLFRRTSVTFESFICFGYFRQFFS